MTTARARYIPELLEIHWEELAYLWGQRRDALYSEAYTLREFVELTERAEAHIQGLLAVPHALPGLLPPRWQAEDRDEVFAAVCPLLRLADARLTGLVLESFASAQGPALAGFRDAFSFAPAGLYVQALKKALNDGPPAQACAAAVALANVRELDAANPRLPALLAAETPNLAELAWLAVAHCDSPKPTQAPARPFKHGLLHPSPAVRSAAWQAAVWTRQAWVLPSLRQMAATGDIAALGWLAALGGPQDLPQIVAAVQTLPNPEQAASVLARLGHPRVLDLLGKWMMGEDMAFASAAAAAFTLMTGFDIQGERKTLPAPPDADEFDREFAPDVWLPDMGKAKAWWQHHRIAIGRGSRWRRGMELGANGDPQSLASLDLAARWDVYARAALAGRPVGAPPPVFV